MRRALQRSVIRPFGASRLNAMPMEALDRQLINRLQEGLPLTPRPYADIAAEVGCDEATVLQRIEALLSDGTLTRFGPLFNADRMGGANVLAAMAVPEARFTEVAEQVNAHPEIAHNYAREHALNMWFVAAARTPEQVEAVFVAIAAETGLPVYRFPKQQEFFVDLRLPV